MTDPEKSSCPPGTSQATTPLMMHVWLVDNACHHRFGGVGVEGLHCSHDPGHSDDPGHDEDKGHDGGMLSPQPVPVAPPAQPVAGQPTFTG